MKLNDPFGRMERRHEQEYLSLCQSLKEAGVQDRQAAEALCQRLDKRGRIALMVIVPVTLALILIFAAYAVPLFLFGLVIGVWVVNTTRKAKGYIRRYIDEQVDKTPPEQG